MAWLKKIAGVIKGERKEENRMGKINIFVGSQVDIEGKAIRWDNRTCFLSAISQIWIGKLNKNRAEQSEAEGKALNIELVSGSLHSFLSDDEDFLQKAYELLCKITSEGASTGKCTIDFEKNLLQNHEEPEPAVVYSRLSPVQKDLMKLLDYLKKREKPSTAEEQLLGEIAGYYDGTCEKEIHELYKTFVQLSLINECNELGLSTLIDEVRANIYRA